MVFIRYYTVFNFIAIFALSLGIYYAFMWVAGNMTFFKTYASIAQIHDTPLYFLTIFLCVGLTFSVDLFLTGIKYNIYTSPSDFLRTIVSRKLKVEDHEEEFNAIYSEIRTKIVKEDVQQEIELEQRREQMAAYLERQLGSKAKIKPLAH